MAIRVIFKLFALIGSVLALVGCEDSVGTTKVFNIEIVVEVSENENVYQGKSVWQLTMGSASSLLSSNNHLQPALAYEAIPISLSEDQIIFVTGLGGESSFSIRHIAHKLHDESNRKYLKRISEISGWVNAMPSDDKMARAFLVCFSKDFEYGIADLKRMQHTQMLCEKQITVQKFQWRITQQPFVTGEVAKVIGKDKMAQWRERIDIDNVERLRATNGRNFEKEIKFKKAFELLTSGAERLEKSQ